MCLLWHGGQVFVFQAGSPFSSIHTHRDVLVLFGYKYMTLPEVLGINVIYSESQVL